jgi:pimeloyl-ACP methyl ester carboxylesterase
VDLKRLTNHWLTKFDWRAVEAKINKIPQFTTPITVENFSPIDMHFVHQKSSNPNAIPLLFVHGWPGSFLEVSKLLPLLKEGGAGKPAFHIVAPSLPNYGFSGFVNQQGFALAQYAEVCHKTMLALGYDQYVCQGGDWGFLITRIISKLFPQHCRAVHTNWAFAAQPKWDPASNPEPTYTNRELMALARGQEWYVGDGRGYLAIQGTKPGTIGFSHRDSPVALLAWIYEKLALWTDDYPWTDDEILTWVSIYLFSTAGPEAGSYTYYEALHNHTLGLEAVQGYIDVPLGLADFPKELFNSPRSWRGGMGPVVFEKVYEKGGHFAAWERPEDLAAGLQEMFGEGGGAKGVVEGKSGL